MRRTLLPVVVLLLAPALAGASSAGAEDPRGDATLDVAPYRSGPVRAQAAGCDDAAVDLVGFSVTSDGETLELRLSFADLAATPSCRGVPLERRWFDVHMDLTSTSGGWVAVSFLGGDNCRHESPWACGSVWTADGHGHAGEAGLEGNDLVWRLPLAGQTDLGHAYDLRGRTYEAEASAQSRVGASALDPAYLRDDVALAPVAL